MPVDYSKWVRSPQQELPHPQSYPLGNQLTLRP
jgi:hypothetical protein